MDFGEALRIVKQGGEVTRAGWNGKGMYIYLIHLTHLRGSYDAILPCIAMMTAQGEVQPGWLASQADMLADDWMGRA